jgi:CO dehydrogenase nickel-insertion accessory protein CooC1
MRMWMRRTIEKEESLENFGSWQGRQCLAYAGQPAATCAEASGYHVLVVDSDESNSGLYRMLGFPKPPVPLMELVGGKGAIKEKIGWSDVLTESRMLSRIFHLVS